MRVVILPIRRSMWLSAVAACGIAASSVDAAIVSFEGLNLEVNGTFPDSAYHVSVYTASFVSVGSQTFTVSGAGTQLRLSMFQGDVLRAPSSLGTSLPIGITVGPAGSYVPNSATAVFGTLPGEWRIGQVNYFGFRFFDWSAFATRYGYGAMLVGATSNIRTITALYYEDSGAGIEVVPSPGAIALLGLSSLVSRRRR